RVFRFGNGPLRDLNAKLSSPHSRTSFAGSARRTIALYAITRRWMSAPGSARWSDPAARRHAIAPGSPIRATTTESARSVPDRLLLFLGQTDHFGISKR